MLKVGVAVLDMDGTILSKRSIDVLCERFGLTSKLRQLDLDFREAPRSMVTMRIAELLSGKGRSELEDVFDTIPLNAGVHEFISFLRERGFVIALATDSYKFLADRLKNRLHLDLVYANRLQFNGYRLTGKVLTVPGCLKIPHCKEYLVCKLRLLKSLQSALGGVSVAIGDGDSDYCMLLGANISVAYNPKTERIKAEADAIVQDFYQAIAFLKQRLD
ncbi:HAD family phosphatase [Candidatus Bathyarchaeota archaeon]|nr:HAD family phosphatase [Candidatus Bathyarchaeota archaeon]